MNDLQGWRLLLTIENLKIWKFQIEYMSIPLAYIYSIINWIEHINVNNFDACIWIVHLVTDNRSFIVFKLNDILTHNTHSTEGIQIKVKPELDCLHMNSACFIIHFASSIKLAYGVAVQLVRILYLFQEKLRHMQNMLEFVIEKYGNYCFECAWYQNLGEKVSWKGVFWFSDTHMYLLNSTIAYYW